MKIALLYGILLTTTLFCNATIAQDASFPVIENGYLQYDETGQNISYGYKTLMSYNEKGLLKRIKYVEWPYNESHEWFPVYTSTYFYNALDQLTRNETIQHSREDPNLAHIIQSSVYEYHEDILYSITSHYIYVNDDAESFNTEFFDENGRIYKTIRNRTHMGEQSSHSKSYTEWDENGCETYSVDSIFYYRNGNIEGSIVQFKIKEYTRDCKIKKSTFYDLNPHTNTQGIRFIQYFDYTFDTNDNLTDLYYYSNLEPWDTTLTLLEEQHYQYSSKGNLTESTQISGHGDNKIKTSHHFNDHGYEESSLEEEWNPVAESWDPRYQSILTYNENNRLEVRDNYADFDTSENVFLYHYHIEYAYNEFDSLSYEFSIATDSGSQPPVIEKSEKHYSYDCLGRFLEIEYWDLNNNKMTSKLYTRYLDTPECEMDFNIELDFTLFPNPAKDFLHISFNKLVNLPAIVISDINGRRLTSSVNQYNNLYSIDISSLVPGIYIISLISDSEISSIKFIKS